jgi:PAS domain S-box-containing protein
MSVWPLNPYSTVLIAAAAICLGTAAVGWKRRRNPGGIHFVLLMVSVAWWAATAAYELSSASVSSRIWSGKLQYLSVASVAPLWLLFALGLGQRLKTIKPIRQALMWLLPVVLVALAFSNERHGLIWPTIRPVSPLPGARLIYGHGPAVWIFLAYSYLFLLSGTALLIRDALRFHSLYRRQAVWLIAGALFPWVGNAVYMLKLGPVGLDLTPLGFTAGGLFVGYSLFRYKLLDIVPVAHGVLIDSIADSIIVLDAENRILELNPAARRLLGISSDFAGRSLIEFLRPWPDFIPLAASLLTETGDRLVRCPEIKRWMDVRISPLPGRHGEVSGRLIVLRDVTEAKAGEEAQAAFLDRIERQKQAIVGLAFHPAISAGDLPNAAAAIVEAAARALRVERVGIWLGNLEEGRITCFDLFELSKERHSSGLVLEAGSYPAYFQAIESDRAVDAHDACADPRTAEFCDGYLRPRGITSLLDAPIRASGRMKGIVCFEHSGPIRKWLPDEIRFAAEIADQTALALLNRERKRV